MMSHFAAYFAHFAAILILIVLFFKVIDPKWLLATGCKRWVTPLARRQTG